MIHLQYPSLKKVCELKGHKTEIITLSAHPSKQQVYTDLVWNLSLSMRTLLN